MRARTTAVLLPLLLAACSSASVDRGSVSGSFARSTIGSSADDINDIRTYLSVEPDEIVPGEPVRLVLGIDNATERDVRIRFPDSRQTRLYVFGATGEPLVDDFTVTLPEILTLGALETWERKIEWDGRVRPTKRNPMALEAGTYELQVRLRKIEGLYVNATNRFPIVVRD